MCKMTPFLGKCWVILWGHSNKFHWNFIRGRGLYWIILVLFPIKPTKCLQNVLNLGTFWGTNVQRVILPDGYKKNVVFPVAAEELQMFCRVLWSYDAESEVRATSEYHDGQGGRKAENWTEESVLAAESAEMDWLHCRGVVLRSSG